MITNLKNKILWLLLIFFISPFGFGLTFIPGLQSLDLPKIIPFLFFIIIIFNFNFRKIDKTIYLFLILIFLHLFSIFYSPQTGKSLVDFFSNLFIYYSGFILPFYILDSENSLKKLMSFINVVVLLYIFFSISEFVLQVNFFDAIRNSYSNENARFNNQLGLMRIGFKSSMGPFASTLPFAYTFLTLFFLRKLYIPKKLNNKLIKTLIIIFGALGIIFTFSRAAIFILFFLILIEYLFLSKFSTKFFFSLFLLFSIIFIGNKIKNSPFEKYIDTYILGIAENKQGTDLRLDNNVTDFNFALESPIIGHGAGMLYQNKSKGNLTSSDSSFLLNVFADRGLVSLFVFLAIFIITIKRGYKLYRINSNTFEYKSLLFALISIFLCLNSSNRLEVLFLFYFLLGLINKVYILNKKNVNIYNNSNI